MTIDPKDLRQAFGRFLTGVTVVTTVDTDGNRFGFTANSFTSVSIDPPLLLVCPGKFLSSFHAFQNCTHFAVNILAEGQEDIANVFAGHKGDRFAKVNWTPNVNGVPLIQGTVAQFSCSTHQIHPAGDHIILIGEVQGFAQSDQRGLGYSSGRFFSLAMERDSAAAHPDGQNIAGAIIETQGHVLLHPSPQGLRLPQIDMHADLSARQALDAHFEQSSATVSLGKAFSIFTDRPSGTRFTYIQATTDTLDPRLGEWVPLDGLTSTNVALDTEAVMLRRYLLERSTGHFGLYVGNEQSGDIHIYTEGA